jgi:hypothetical protein
MSLHHNKKKKQSNKNKIFTEQGTILVKLVARTKQNGVDNKDNIIPTDKQNTPNSQMAANKNDRGEGPRERSQCRKEFQYRYQRWAVGLKN